MIRELTDEERGFLVDYCMKPENTWLALAICQVQLALKTAIVSSFLKGLDESIKVKLKERGLHCQWETRIMETNLEVQYECIYVMTMKDPEIEIHLTHEKSNLFVGTPAANGDCPDLASFFEDTDLALEPNNDFWRWWFYPEPSHKSFEALSTLHDDELRRDEIAYFTDMLVHPAEAISKALGT